MGAMTRLQIVTEGMLRAGRDDLALRANVWLQLWLDSIANSWPWPTLVREGSFSLLSGTNVVGPVGNGAAGITDIITRVLDNCYAYTADKKMRSRLRIKPYLSDPNSLYDMTAMKGLPTECRVVPATNGLQGQWGMEFRPAADRDYLISFDYVCMPPPLAGDSTVPWYQNDITMVTAVEAEVHKYADGPDSPAYQAILGVLADMARNDRMRYGASPGINDRMQLDSDVFRD